jgi:trans-2,3-dihydro-3-hydroxyanthranilate isomerase
MTEASDARAIRFSLIDVFTDEPLAGNPLALVIDGDRLTEAQMRRLAREFNQSETTFLLSATRPEAEVRLRSFTPSGAEVFGAGHNALGAWWWLAASGALPVGASPAHFAQELGDRVLPVEVVSEAGRIAGIVMIQGSVEFGAVLEDRQALADALHLHASDLEEDAPPQVVGTGAAHLLVPVKSRRALESARPDAEILRPLLQEVGGQGCYVFCLEPYDPAATALARFFNPTVGIWEDPATGSAAGPLAAYLIAAGKTPPDREVVIEQGHSMGRPSRMRVRIRDRRVRISGRGVIVAEGVLRL